MSPEQNPLASMSIQPMCDASAYAIANWRYPEPYTFYNSDQDVDDLSELLDPARRRGRYYEALDGQADLVGFYEFKHDQKPLEIGLGLRPDLTGRGLGLEFVTAGMTFARQQFHATTIALAVATFNQRAIKVYEAAGFRPVTIYQHHTNGREYEFMRMTYDQEPG